MPFIPTGPVEEVDPDTLDPVKKPTTPSLFQRAISGMVGVKSPSPESFDIGRRVVTMSPAPEKITFLEDPLPSALQRFLYGTVDMKYPAPEGRDIAGMLGSAAPTMIGAATAGPAGAAIGKGVQNIAHEIGAAVQPDKFPDLPPMSAATGPLVEAGVTKYVPVVAGKIAEVAKPAVVKSASVAKEFAKGAFQSMAKTMSGISQEAMDRLSTRAPELMTYAKLGKEAALEHARHLVGGIRTTVENLHRDASIRFGQELKRIGAKYDSVRVDVAKNMSSVLHKMEMAGDIRPPEPPARAVLTPEEIQKAAMKQKLLDIGGATTPPKMESGVLDFFANKIRQMKSASILELDDLQRSIQSKIDEFRGTPLSVKLGSLKASVLDVLDSLNIKEIADNNRAYRVAHNTVRQLQMVRRADDLVGTIKSIMRRGTRSGQELISLAEKSPQLKAELNAVLDAIYGAEFGPVITQKVARTGLTGAIGTMAGKALGGELGAIAGAATTFPFMSPRLVGHMGETAAAVGKVGQRAAASFESNLPSVAQLARTGAEYGGEAAGVVSEAAKTVGRGYRHLPSRVRAAMGKGGRALPALAKRAMRKEDGDEERESQ